MVSIDGFLIDATVSQSHDRSFQVTSHPVEAGADVTDHVRALPVRLTLDCVVSNAPLEPVASAREIDTRPSDDAHAHMKALQKRPVTVETDLEVYQNMVLESLTEPVTAQTGDGLRFTAVFQQIELVTNERATVPVAVPRAKKKVNRGSKPPKSAPDKATEPPAKVRDGGTIQWRKRRRRLGKFAQSL